MAVVVTEAAPAATGVPAAAPRMEQFRGLFEERAAGRAASLDEELRAASLAELLAAGFPLRRDEEWVHTPLRAVAEAHYRLGSAVSVPSAADRSAELVRELVAGEPVALLTCNGALASPAAFASLIGTAAQSDIAGVRCARGDLWPRCREAFTRPLTTAFTLPAGQISASIELKGKPDADTGSRVSYFRPFTRDLIAKQDGMEIDRTPLAVHAMPW